MRSLWVTIISGALLAAASAVGATAQADAASRPPIPSLGCGASEVDAGQHDGTMRVGDTHRWWDLHVPPAHDGDSPVPLVLLFHGFPNSPNIIESQTGFGRYVVVAP